MPDTIEKDNLVEKHSNNLTPKLYIPENRTARDRDNREQIRELEIFQRNLAVRIREIERVARRGQASGTG